MKAWCAEIEDAEAGAIVFADTRQKARAEARCCDGFADAEFYDIHVVRAAEFDGREKNPPTLEELVRDHAWWTDCRCGWRVTDIDELVWERDACVSCEHCRADRGEEPPA